MFLGSRTSAIIQGLMIGGLLSMAHLIMWLLFFMNDKTATGEITHHYDVLFWGIFLTLSSGAIMGYFAGRIETGRFWKLFLIVIILYWINAWVIGLILMLSEPNEPFGDIIAGSFFLSLGGSIMYSWIAGPILAGLIFMLERISRQAPTR